MAKGRDQLNWKSVCLKTKEINPSSNDQIREFFESNFQLYEIRQAQTVGQYSAGSNQGMITGYYEPEIKGSKTRQGIYQTPLHAYPYSENSKKNKKDKYPTRQELLATGELNGLELAWVADPVAAAFMQIQGSGKILLDNGEVLRLGFAGTNEQPFKSFAQWLIDRKEITKANASMQSIQEWARKNPDRVTEMLNANPRYVFFKKIFNQEGPIGAIGVPLVEQRSIAVDWRSIPKGVPVYLSTTYPNSSNLLQRLVFAQDTGVAIVGGVRADFYWGSGDAAAEKAGRMKQVGKMWVLLPK
jgi:membrane-bound lytic murein transglycosylase A